MKIRFCTLLTAATVALSPLMANAITIKTNDEKTFEVPEGSIKHMITLKKMLEDLPSDPEAIPVPIHSKIFKLILSVLAIIKYEPNKDLWQNKIEDYLYTNIEDKDYKTLVNLILAVKFLDFGILLDGSTSEFAFRISRIETKDDVTKIAQEIIPDIKTIVLDKVLPELRHELEVCHFTNTTQFEEKTLEGHTNNVSVISYGPNGKYLASGSSDNTIKIWNTKTGEVVLTFKKHESPVFSIDWSPDGKSIVSGSTNGTIKIWHAETGKEILTFVGHTKNVAAVAFSSDGEYIVSGSWDKTIKTWNAKTGNEIKTFSGHTNNVSAVAFSPDGEYIVSGSWDKTIKIWDAETGETTKTLKGHEKPVLSVYWSPDDKHIASGSSDKTIKTWDIETNKLIKTFSGHTMSVSSVAYSPDSRHIVSGSWDKTVRIWYCVLAIQVLMKTLENHTDWVLSVDFSPNGKYVASGSADNTIKIWQLFDDTTWETLNKIATKDENGNWITQLTFEQVLELSAKMNNKSFSFENITDQNLINLINTCP